MGALLVETVPNPADDAATREMVATLSVVGTPARTPLARLRGLYGLSQAELGRRVGISRAQLGRIERGKCTPFRRTAERLADVFDVKPADLFPQKQSGPRVDASPTETVGTTCTDGAR